MNSPDKQTETPNIEGAAKAAPIKHQYLEFLVLIAFVVAWLITKDPIIATLVLTGGTILQMLVMLVTKTPMTKMQKAMFAAIILGGGLTVLFKDPQFIQWKLTIVNGIFAAALLVMQLLGKAPIKTMLESMTANQGTQLSLPDKAWNQITFIFIGFFAAIAAANAYITLYLTFEIWTEFKVALFFVSFIFLPAVLMYFIMKHKAIPETQDQSENKE